MMPAVGGIRSAPPWASAQTGARGKRRVSMS
jgi:hypothetical protein